MTPQRKPMLRMQFSKLGRVRFTSHRDVARILERGVRRVGLPVAYSQGFSPRARLSFGLALPTAFESTAEYVDVILEETVPLDGLAKELTACLSQGITVNEIVKVDTKVDSLQACVAVTRWSLFLQGDPGEVQGWVRSLLGSSELIMSRERKGQTRQDDVRPAIVDLAVGVSDEPARGYGQVEMIADLATKPRALRPLELLAIEALPASLALGRRTMQFIEPVGARMSPLDAARAGAAAGRHSMVCAS